MRGVPLASSSSWSGSGGLAMMILASMPSASGELELPDDVVEYVTDYATHNLWDVRDMSSPSSSMKTGRVFQCYFSACGFESNQSYPVFHHLLRDHYRPESKEKFVDHLYELAELFAGFIPVSGLRNRRDGSGKSRMQLKVVLEHCQMNMTDARDHVLIPFNRRHHPGRLKTLGDLQEILLMCTDEDRSALIEADVPPEGCQLRCPVCGYSANKPVVMIFHVADAHSKAPKSFFSKNKPRTFSLNNTFKFIYAFLKFNSASPGTLQALRPEGIVESYLQRYLNIRPLDPGHPLDPGPVNQTELQDLLHELEILTNLRPNLFVISTPQ